MVTPATPKPHCPKCDIEIIEVNGALPEKCAKCGLNFSQFNSFEELLDAYIAKKKKLAPPKKEGEKEQGFFDILGNI